MPSALEKLTERVGGERQTLVPKIPTPRQVLEYVELAKKKLDQKKQKSKKKSRR